MQFGVAPRLDKEVNIRGDDVVGAALGDHRLDAIDGPGEGHPVEWNAEYVDGPRCVRGARGRL
jgi:hypothetical protein